MLTLLRNNGFLHSFRNFWKSNAFSKNLIRTNFILHKSFFRMSIFSSSKISWMFFNLRWRNCKKHLWEDISLLRGRGRLVAKINITLFCRKWGFEYFSLKNFFKKKNTFQNNAEKNFFGEGDDHFAGNRVSNDKNEYDLFYGKWGTEYGFEVFSSKWSTVAEWKPNFWGGGTFSSYQWFYSAIVSKNNRFHPWVNPHQPSEFYEN